MAAAAEAIGLNTAEADSVLKDLDIDPVLMAKSCVTPVVPPPLGGKNLSMMRAPKEPNLSDDSNGSIEVMF